MAVLAEPSAWATSILPSGFGAVKTPRERDLGRSGAVPLRDLGQGAAALAAQREERDEHDPLAGAVVDDVFPLPLGEVVVVLDGRDRQHRASLLDLLDADLADADMPDLPCVHILLDRSEALLERRLGIDAVQVVELDAARLQPAKALFDLSAKHLWAALARAEAALRADDDALWDRRERGADRLLALAAGVEVGGVDRPDAGGDRLLDEGDVLARVGEPVRPEPDAGDLGIADPQLRGGHRPTVPSRCREPAQRSVLGVTVFPERRSEMAIYMLVVDFQVGVVDTPMEEWKPEEIEAHLDYYRALHKELVTSGELVASEVLAPPGVEDLLRELAPHVLGVLARRTGDFDAAEDAVQEALLAAALHWPQEGVPDNPRGWLIQAAVRQLIDQWRSEQSRREREALAREDRAPEVPDQDDTLTVLFMCCHPALTPVSATALTL